MHKIFAKPSFLGKNVVYLPQCHSTNDELAELAKKSKLKEGTLLYAGFQSKGKGQRGNKWLSEPNKNLLMSLLLKPTEVFLFEQYYLNLVAGLSVIGVLDELFDASKFLKWPNDIYVGENKIGGILIESNVKKDKIETAILGIGLNVNQSDLPLPKATSILLESNRFHDIDQVIEMLLCQIEKWYEMLLEGRNEEIKSAYYEKLMWMNEIHNFKELNKEFKGEIIGIDEHGRLLINLVDGSLKAFHIKEVEFIK